MTTTTSANTANAIRLARQASASEAAAESYRKLAALATELPHMQDVAERMHYAAQDMEEDAEYRRGLAIEAGYVPE